MLFSFHVFCESNTRFDNVKKLMLGVQSAHETCALLQNMRLFAVVAPLVRLKLLLVSEI